MTTDDERAARYSDLFAGEHEHASDCAYCPICATIAVVRNTKPEVLEHLATAAREVIAAVGLMLEEAESVIGAAEAQHPRKPDGDDEGKVRRIDIG
ncbi:MAG: DUF5304 family protein [Actinomycetota bacterium]